MQRCYLHGRTALAPCLQFEAQPIRPRQDSDRYRLAGFVDGDAAGVDLTGQGLREHLYARLQYSHQAGRHGGGVRALA